MGAVIAMATILVIALVAVAVYLYQPEHRRLLRDKHALQKEVDRLNEMLKKKDKELEAALPWVPWYVTVKETDGTQE